MFRFPARRMTTVAAAALLSLPLTAGAASAASTDTTPPTAPFLGYAEGFQCLMVILGTSRSTDNVTPSAQLRYEAFADGQSIGSFTDGGQLSGPWAILHVTKPGPNTITVRAVDSAGNRSAASRGVVVTGYYTPGCTPGHLP